MASTTRNQSILFVGLLFVLIGGQLRAVESFVLTPEATRMLAKVADSEVSTPSGTIRQVILDAAPIRKVVMPPRWIGWALLSVGIVVSAYALKDRMKAN